MLRDDEDPNHGWWEERVKAAGVPTGPGHDHVNVANTYLAYHVIPNTNGPALTNLLGDAGVLAVIIRHYGVGILVLAPRGLARTYVVIQDHGSTLANIDCARFTRWSRNFTEIICDLANEVFPAFQEFCQYLSKTIGAAVLDGDASYLDKQLSNANDAYPLETLQAAYKDAYMS